MKMKESNLLLIIGVFVSVLLTQVNSQGEQVPTDEVGIVHEKQFIVRIELFAINVSIMYPLHHKTITHF